MLHHLSTTNESYTFLKTSQLSEVGIPAEPTAVEPTPFESTPFEPISAEPTSSSTTMPADTDASTIPPPPSHDPPSRDAPARDPIEDLIRRTLQQYHVPEAEIERIIALYRKIKKMIDPPVERNGETEVLREVGFDVVVEWNGEIEVLGEVGSTDRFVSGVEGVLVGD